MILFIFVDYQTNYTAKLFDVTYKFNKIKHFNEIM